MVHLFTENRDRDLAIGGPRNSLGSGIIHGSDAPEIPGND